VCLGLSAYWLKEVLDYHQSPQGRLAERLLSRDRTMLGLVFALAAMLLIVGCTGAQPTSEPTKGIFAASTGSSPGDSDGGFTITSDGDSSGGFTITSDGDSSGGFTITSDGDSSGGFTITSDGDSDANVEEEEAEDTGAESEVIEEIVEEEQAEDTGAESEVIEEIVEEGEAEDTGAESEVFEETVEEQEERKRKLRQSEAENVDVDIGI